MDCEKKKVCVIGAGPAGMIALKVRSCTDHIIHIRLLHVGHHHLTEITGNDCC